MDSEDFEGGSEDSNKGRKFYVIGAARSARIELSSHENEDLMEDIPLQRSAVEQIFIKSGQTLGETFSHHMPKNEHETFSAYRQRVETSWKELWKEEALNSYKETHGFDDERAKGSGIFRWDVRRQKLEDLRENTFCPIESLTRFRALQRLKIIWDWIGSLPKNIRDLVPFYEKDGYATLSDDSFIFKHWSQEKKINVPNYIHKYLKETNDFPEDFQTNDIWKDAIISMFSKFKSDQQFRLKYSNISPDVFKGQVSFEPTESKITNKNFKLGDFIYKNNRYEVTNQDKLYEYFKSFQEDSSGLKPIKFQKYLDIPKTIFGKSFQGLLLSKGFIALPLQQLSNINEKHLKDCLEGFDVTEETLKQLLDPKSEVYEEIQSDTENERAFNSIFAVVDDKETLEAVVWCQKWECANESKVFSIKPNPMSHIFFNKLTEKDCEKIEDGMTKSLYIRASGSRRAKNRRLCFALQAFCIAENSDGNFKGIISRVPRTTLNNLFAPNFATLSDTVQILGLQRSFGVKFLPGLSDAKTETEKRSIVANAIKGSKPVTFSLDCLKTFDFSLTPPWEIQLKPESYKESKNILNLFSESMKPKDYHESLADSNVFQSKLKVFFAARIFPNAPQMMQAYVVLKSLFVENYFVGGSLENSFNEDEDGELTVLEKLASQSSLDKKWLEKIWTHDISKLKF